jgi:hypothetical protein
VNCKFGGDRFSRNHCPCLPQVEDNAGIVAGGEILPDGTAHLSWEIAGIYDIFYSDRDALQLAQW